MQGIETRVIPTGNHAWSEQWEEACLPVLCVVRCDGDVADGRIKPDIEDLVLIALARHRRAPLQVSRDAATPQASLHPRIRGLKTPHAHHHSLSEEQKKQRISSQYVHAGVPLSMLYTCYHSAMPDNAREEQRTWTQLDDQPPAWEDLVM